MPSNAARKLNSGQPEVGVGGKTISKEEVPVQPNPLPHLDSGHQGLFTLGKYGLDGLGLLEREIYP